MTECQKQKLLGYSQSILGLNWGVGQAWAEILDSKNSTPKWLGVLFGGKFKFLNVNKWYMNLIFLVNLSIETYACAKWLDKMHFTSHFNTWFKSHQIILLAFQITILPYYGDIKTPMIEVLLLIQIWCIHKRTWEPVQDPLDIYPGVPSVPK